MDDNCSIVGFVYPVQNLLGFVYGYDQVLGFVNQNPLAIIVGFTNC